MTKMLRPLLPLALGLLLSGCVSYNHLDSQRRMETGIQALQAAERKTYAKTDPNATTADQLAAVPLVDTSVDDLRIALAADAKADLQATNNAFAGATAGDQISALTRAAIKGWQAGAPGGKTVDKAVRTGLQLCKRQKTPPARDCGILTVATYLSTLEENADVLVTYDALVARNVLHRVGPDAAAQNQFAGTAITDISTSTSNILANLDDLNKAPALLKTWIGRQKLAYLCHAIAGEQNLGWLSKRNLSPATKATAKDKQDQLTPRVTAALTAFDTAYPGVLATKNLAAADRSCRTFFDQK